MGNRPIFRRRRVSSRGNRDGEGFQLREKGIWTARVSEISLKGKLLRVFGLYTKAKTQSFRSRLTNDLAAGRIPRKPTPPGTRVCRFSGYPRTISGSKIRAKKPTFRVESMVTHRGPTQMPSLNSDLIIIYKIIFLLNPTFSSIIFTLSHFFFTNFLTLS